MTTLRSRSSLVLAAALSICAGCGSESGSDQAQSEATESLSFPTAALIDPNTAAEAALAAVPGLPASAVAAILAERPFATPVELHAAIGDLLGAENQAYEYMFVKVGLNSGAESDYQLIPSSMPARRLAHEFEEYRPYESMDQFRREMSKYVSDEEVAYLARYVTLD